MDNWNEIKTAYQVARLGTVSAAAEALNVHRSTVIRHIDALEAAFGAKIFLRHAQGYTPTDLGFDLMRVARATDEQFNQLMERAKADTAELSGEFILTSMYALAPLLIPILKAFQASYPNVTVRYLTSDRLFRLDHGEAHVAVRAGPKPNLSDHIVHPFIKTRMGLYASTDYIDRNGVPQRPEEFKDHCFVGLDNDAGPPSNLNSWMRNNIPKRNVVLRSTDVMVTESAILSGMGIGFFPVEKARQHSNLIEIWPHQDQWDVSFWLMTHADLYQTAKVQAFLTFLRQETDEPEC
ncbi:MAG: LysR family transcriptional regulator [Cyanobacteria bacterium P01_F01_bin.150]